MAFFVFAVSFMLSISMMPLITAQLPCKDIIDIYYARPLESQAYDVNCRYTKTEIACVGCANVYISRKHYNRFVTEYKKKNIGPCPFPRRTDVDRVFPARYLGTSTQK